MVNGRHPRLTAGLHYARMVQYGLISPDIAMSNASHVWLAALRVGTTSGSFAAEPPAQARRTPFAALPRRHL
jgi:hypothetical protein